MTWRTLLEEKEAPGHLSTSRLLMLAGGGLFALVVLAGVIFSFAFALPRLLSGRWTPSDTTTALAFLDFLSTLATLSVALAAPYAVNRLPKLLSTLRRTAPEVVLPATDPADEPEDALDIEENRRKIGFFSS